MQTAAHSDGQAAADSDTAPEDSTPADTTIGVQSDTESSATATPSPSDTTVQPTLSVIIPTYNEAPNIEQIVDRTINAVTDAGIQTEVIVVDDDSPDGTWRKARDLYQDVDAVTVIRRTTDPGLSKAVLRGVAEATNDVVLVIDADLQHPPEKIPNLIDAFDEDTDLVVGSRHVEGGGIENWSTTRRIGSDISKAMAQFAVPSTRTLTDPMSGFFAVRRPLVEDITLRPKGFKILVDIIGRADITTDQITEVPYTFTDRDAGESKFDAGEIWKSTEHITELGLLERGFDRFLDPGTAIKYGKFAIVGALGTLVNSAVFYAIDTGLSQSYLLAAAIAYIVAVHFNFVGDKFFTFDNPDGSLTKQYVGYQVDSAAGFVIYIVLLAGFVQIGILPNVIWNVAAIFISSVVKFAAADHYIF